MKKVVQYFSLILFSAFFMVFLSANSVNALYDSERNTVGASINKNEIKIGVNYQRGFVSEESSYQWCSSYNGGSACINKVRNSSDVELESIAYGNVGGDANLSYIAKGDATYTDGHSTFVTFSVPKTIDPLLRALSDENEASIHREQTYTLLITTYFCTVRIQSNGEYIGCQYIEPKYTAVQVSVNDLLNNNNIGVDVEDVEDEDIQTMLEKISEIVYDTIIPIIWAVLGLVLVVKGTITGVQIVKAADEPQVRMEKVHSLKWLVIGVAIAAAASFAVRLVTGYFKGAFGG